MQRAGVPALSEMVGYCVRTLSKSFSHNWSASSMLSDILWSCVHYWTLEAALYQIQLYSFIHWFLLHIFIVILQVHYCPKALPATCTALILRWSWHAEAPQATTSEGLAQGPYVAARVEFKPATFRTQGTEPTTEQSCLIVLYFINHSCIVSITFALYQIPFYCTDYRYIVSYTHSTLALKLHFVSLYSIKYSCIVSNTIVL